MSTYSFEKGQMESIQCDCVYSIPHSLFNMAVKITIPHAPLPAQPLHL